MMRALFLVGTICGMAVCAAEPATLYRSDFFQPLGKEWHWGLGTWSTGDGVLRGFESGPRRHGPVKMQKLAFTDATFDFDVRLIGRAHWASVVFNNDAGHLFIVTLARSSGTLVIHKSAQKDDPAGQPERIAEVPLKIAPDAWQHVRIRMAGDTVAVAVGDVSATGKHAVIAMPKTQFGLSGDSGGPEGEKMGALEFRNLIITKP